METPSRHQTPGYNSKGARSATPIMEAFSQSDPNTSGFNSHKSHPTKILLIKDKYSNGIIPHQQQYP
jgi:hypothetical protein